MREPAFICRNLPEVSLKNLLLRQTRRTSTPATTTRCLHLMRSSSTPWTALPPFRLTRTSLQERTSTCLNPTWTLKIHTGQTLQQILLNLMAKSPRSLLPPRSLARPGRPRPAQRPRPPWLNLAPCSSTTPPPQKSSRQRRAPERIRIPVPSSPCGGSS